ncbi:hypothetical protein AUR04nite_34470 [Glutamicibacter uratoxydans]|uniref:Uncharacterized protein n=1 Tax=Glutamicibacter uratoxydans TaxID=43667 RepID=A0A4Y4DWD2_GLUUR|nr:hypothetical protein AUR04nite_34470 [Glutamicibacter uratoxydans]
MAAVACVFHRGIVLHLCSMAVVCILRHQCSGVAAVFGVVVMRLVERWIG